MTVHLLSPGDPSQRTGGYLYNAAVVSEWRRQGVAVVVHAVDGQWPMGPAVSTLPELSPGSVVLADGLLWTGLGEQRKAFAHTKVTVLVHLALHLGGGLDAGERPQRQRLERDALDGVFAVVATGRPTLDALRREGVALIPPGTDAVHIGHGQPTALLTVASITRRKGFLDLIKLLEGVDAPWTWEIAGSLVRDAGYAAEVLAAVHQRGWEERVHFLGELDADGMNAAYRRAGLLLHGASHEPYGMALCEAVGMGLGVITRPAGALFDLPAGSFRVFDTVEEGRRALTQGIRSFESMHNATKGAAFPSWATTAGRLWEVMHG